MATNDINSYAGITEHSWTGTSPEDVNVSIEAIGAHFQIVQIAFNFDGSNTGSESEELTATTNHIESSRLDTEIFAQNAWRLVPTNSTRPPPAITSLMATSA